MLPTTFPHAPHSFINPEPLYDPSPNGYTHVVVATMPARVVYVAGQGGEDSAGQLAVDFELQVTGAD
jgi:enamine deaminase RidA (YjgF/YER057c/UK114 family)